MISISHNGGLNAAAAGLAKGVEIGSQQALQKRALSQRDRALDMQKVESEAQIKLAQDESSRRAENDALSRTVQQENLAYTRQLRGEREQEGHALDLLDELRAAGDEYNAINAPADSPLSEDYVGPGSKQLEVIQKLSEAAKKLGRDAHRAVMQEKASELAFTVLAKGAKKQAQRIAVLSGAGTPLSGVPLGIMSPEQGDVLIQGMEQFIASRGESGLNPIEVGQELTKLQKEESVKASYQAEGVRTLGTLTQRHAQMALAHPEVPFLRAGAVLADMGMQQIRTQEELESYRSNYYEALSQDLSEEAGLAKERMRSQGRGNGTGSGQRGGWNQKDLYDAAVKSLQPEFMEKGPLGEQVPTAIPIERVRTRMREIENGQEMTPDILPMGSVPSTTSQTSDTPPIEVPQDVQMGAQEMYAKARETMSVEEAKKAIDAWIRSQVTPIGEGGDGIEAGGSLIRLRNKQPVSKPKKREPVRTGAGEDYMRDPKVRAALATKPKPRE